MSTETLPDFHLAYVDVGEHSGWALVLSGHDIPAENLAAVAKSEDIDGWRAEEVFWHEHRRVMWCERIDGFGCDSNGEWHRHWSEVKPNDDPATHFTVLWRAPTEAVRPQAEHERTCE